jgi:hypothetical protein
MFKFLWRLETPEPKFLTKSTSIFENDSAFRTDGSNLQSRSEFPALQMEKNWYQFYDQIDLKLLKSNEYSSFTFQSS